MKYEMIFGDETLFDGAPEDVDMIGYSGGFYKNSPDGPMYCCGCTFTTDEYRNKGFIAMRRIIKEPKRWTWEDKKAGRLPEAGVKVTLNLSDEVVKSSAIQSWKNGDELEVLRTFKKDEPKGEYASALFNLRTKTCGLVLTKYLSPIETPAEKAQRLRSEWVKYALDLYMSSPKNDVASMGDVYDALLSGELQVPKGE